MKKSTGIFQMPATTPVPRGTLSAPRKRKAASVCPKIKGIVLGTATQSRQELKASVPDVPSFPSSLCPPSL